MQNNWRNILSWQMQDQVTMNPKSKEVSIKFMDSPEQQNLENAVNQVPQQPAMDSLPKLNTAPPSAGGVGNQEPGSFNDQEVPVSY